MRVAVHRQQSEVAVDDDALTYAAQSLKHSPMSYHRPEACQPLTRGRQSPFQPRRCNFRLVRFGNKDSLTKIGIASGGCNG